jgi:uncharacterized membrane protein YeaQ/YmgE (transglycosylase-associated protein family)
MLQRQHRAGMALPISLHHLIICVAIGVIVGWLAWVIVKDGRLLGLIGNIIVGIIGAYVSWYFSPGIATALGGGIGAEVISALFGAAVFLFIFNLYNR